MLQLKTVWMRNTSESLRALSSDSRWTPFQGRCPRSPLPRFPQVQEIKEIGGSCLIHSPHSSTLPTLLVVPWTFILLNYVNITENKMLLKKINPFQGWNMANGSWPHAQLLSGLSHERTLLGFLKVPGIGIWIINICER